jgi:lipoate-protein ligase B
MRPAVAIHLGLTEYGRALDLQNHLVELKQTTPELPDYLVFVEHPGVFTLGKRGGSENLVVSRAFLEQKGIDIVQTGRGGNITYHGPGQAVCYPIIDLEKADTGVKDFVFTLEQIVIETLSEFGIAAVRDPRNNGVWISGKKIASVGISVKKGITFHGIAINTIMDLTPFSWINPCGMQDVRMTSVEMETTNTSSGSLLQAGTKDINRVLLARFKHKFNYSRIDNCNEINLPQTCLA